MSRRDAGQAAKMMVPFAAFREEKFEDYLPFVSLVDDATVLTVGNEYMQCIRVDGINSMTEDDDVLARLKRQLATIIAQTEGRFSFYIHKISKPFKAVLDPVQGDSFAGELDRRWSQAIDGMSLRDKTLTISILRRPAATKTASMFERLRDRFAADDEDETRKIRQRRVASLNEVVAVVLSATEQMNGRVLTASSGELLGFLEAIGSGNEVPTFVSSELGILARSVANYRPTFTGNKVTLSGGTFGQKYGRIFTIKNYPNQTYHGIFDELSLPLDMVVSHSFVPVNNDVMAERIGRARRMMLSMQDAGVSQQEELEQAADDLVTGKLIFGEHHMTVAVYSDSEEVIEKAAADIRQIAQRVGVKLISEAFASRSHYFAQWPGNASFRSRVATITNRNFAGMASLHRTPLGRRGDELPWETPVTVFPTPERAGYRFSFHPKGTPDQEPPAGHTLMLGPSGGGKSVLIGFLIAQAQRMNARTFVFDYRRGLEVPLKALGGEYSTISADKPTGLNPLWAEVDSDGQQWLSDWLAALIEREGSPLTSLQSQMLHDAIVRNANAAPGLRRWDEFASIFAPFDDSGDLESRIREWAEGGRYGWIFGNNLEDTFSLNSDLVGFDLTSLLDNGNAKERTAVLGYIFRRLERSMQDRRPTVIIIDEAWKALDNDYFAGKLQDWLVTARKLNAVVMLVTQFATQVARSKAGTSMLQGVQNQILIPNPKASEEHFAPLNLGEKEMAIMLDTIPGTRLALVRGDEGAVLIDTDLSALGDFLTVLGGGKAAQRMFGDDINNNPDFWRRAR